MQMNASSIVNQKAEWEKLGVKLPAFDHAAMTAATKEHPIWVHFGAGKHLPRLYRRPAAASAERGSGRPRHHRSRHLRLRHYRQDLHPV
mgnify:CR=1 FL=1